MEQLALFEFESNKQLAIRICAEQYAQTGIRLITLERVINYASRRQDADLYVCCGGLVRDRNRESFHGNYIL